MRSKGSLAKSFDCAHLKQGRHLAYRVLERAAIEVRAEFTFRWDTMEHTVLRMDVNRAAMLKVTRTLPQTVWNRRASQLNPKQTDALKMSLVNETFALYQDGTQHES